MKKLSFLVFIILFATCSRDTIEKDSIDQETTSSNLVTTTATHRGVYVNSFETDILGNTTEENYLLDWCIANNFNEITLYTISSILNTTSQTLLLKDFVERAHSDYNLIVTFVASSKTAINKINTYHADYPGALAAPDGIATEYEFWNGANSFTYYKTQMLKRLKQVDPNFDSSWKQELYISKFEDAEGVVPDNKVINRVAVHFKTGGGNDELFWVNYRNNAFNFPNPVTAPNSYNRIQEIAKKAFKKDIIINIVVLFNVRTDSGSPNIYDYFDVTDGDHDFSDAFDNYKDGFDISGITHKENINMIGYQIYRYSNAKLARPL